MFDQLLSIPIIKGIKYLKKNIIGVFIALMFMCQWGCSKNSDNFSSLETPSTGISKIFTTDEDTALLMEVPLPAEMQNKDPAYLARLYYNITRPSENGVLSNCFNLNFTCKYFPNANFFGEDYVEYEIKDGPIASINRSKIRITVKSINDPPVSGADQKVVGVSHQDLTFSLNTPTDVDHPLTALKLRLLTSAHLQGTLSGCLNDSSSLLCTYRPPSNIDNLTETVVYQVNDGISDSVANGNLTIIIRPELPPTFRLNLKNTGSGAITGNLLLSTGSSTVLPSCQSSECNLDLTTNSQVTLTARAQEGSVFTQWLGDCSRITSNNCIVDMNSDKSVTANFEIMTLKLNVSKTGTGAGSITSNPPGITCGNSCTSFFSYNTVITLTAIPVPGSVFSGWSGACSNTTGTCTVSMNAAKNITATFNLIPAPTQTPTATPTNTPTYPLSVTKTGSGSGTVSSNLAGINCGTDCSENFSSGTTVTLTATAASGSIFAGWSGACSGTGTCTVNMSFTKAVTATFNLIPTPTPTPTPTNTSTYPLSVTKTGSGSGTVTSNPAGINCGTDCSENYSSGTTVTLTATAASGSTFTGWSGACTGVGSCTISMTTAQTVTATFSLSSCCTIRIINESTGLGSINVSQPNGSVVTTQVLNKSWTLTVASGTPLVRLHAQVGEGSIFGNWNNCPSFANNTQCEIANISADITIGAPFILESITHICRCAGYQTYDINVCANEGAVPKLKVCKNYEHQTNEVDWPLPSLLGQASNVPRQYILPDIPLRIILDWSKMKEISTISGFEGYAYSNIRVSGWKTEKHRLILLNYPEQCKQAFGNSGSISLAQFHQVSNNTNVYDICGYAIQYNPFTCDTFFTSGITASIFNFDGIHGDCLNKIKLSW